MNANAREKYDASLKDAQQSGEPANTKVNQTSVNPYQKPVRVIKDSQCAFCDLPHNQGRHIKPDSVCVRCGSALFLATKQNFELSGSRLIHRIEKKWPVSFYLNWEDSRSYIGMAQDVSLNGIQILYNTYVENNAVVKLSSHMLDAVALVVNSRNDHTILRKRWRLGLDFLRLRFHQIQGSFIKVDA